MLFLNRLFSALGKILGEPKPRRRKRKARRTKKNKSRSRKPVQFIRRPKSRGTLSKRELSSSRRTQPAKKTGKKRMKPGTRLKPKRPACAGSKTSPPRAFAQKNKEPASLGPLVGEITHCFSRIMVVVVKMTGRSLAVGEQIRIKGKHTDFAQKVTSLQIESVNVNAARKGQLVGLKVVREAKVGDQVYRAKG